MTSSAGLATNTRRLELYVRWSLYVLLAFEPLVLLGAVPEIGTYAASAVALAHTASNIVVCRWALTAMREHRSHPGPRMRIALAVWAVLSVGVLVMVALGVDSVDTWVRALFVVFGAPLASIAPLLRARTVLLAVLVAGIAIALLTTVTTDLDAATSAGLATSMLFGLLGITFSFWFSGWMLRVVWELDEARMTAAELAIAEERLRISRDLHDLFGRTLAAVAVKSELAAELIRRGRPDAAAEEIGGVRVLADQTGVQVRQVVQGFRRTALDTELEGARSLLDSAGIRCVVRGSAPPQLDPTVADTLAWTLRESVTNVIRHSRATECFITLEGPDPVRLVVTNNGVDLDQSARPGSGGAGLVGMAERLETAGGSLDHQSGEGRFTVEAVVPARRPTVSGTRR